MNCNRDMCFHNLWNDIPCEACPCYQEEQEEVKEDAKAELEEEMRKSQEE